MKINKQELAANIDKLMERLAEDEAFAKGLADKQTSKEISAFLLENGISISADTIDAINDVIKKDFPDLDKQELSEDELEMIAAGGVGKYFKAFFYGATHPVSTLVRVWIKKGQQKIVDGVEKWEPLEWIDGKVV